MRLTRQGPRWWTAWVPLLLVGGALALEPQISLSPGEHQIVRLAMTLLIFGIIVYWLRRNRGALINEAYERERKERLYKSMQQRRESAMSDHECSDDAWRPWKRNGHDTDSQRRQ
jgi:hypothetical protein